MRYLRWLGHLVWFPVFFGYQIAKANVEVGLDVLTPRSRMSAGFVEVPLRSRSNVEISMLANMVTLTPGTVTVAVHAASPTLWIHGLYMDEPDDLRHAVYGLETALLRVTRLSGAPETAPSLGSWNKEQRR